MSQGRELFALDWVKSEIEETLGEARQALETYAEQGKDETRMRVCLTKMHQVHGTLVMLELPGVALLADYLERLAQGLLQNKVTDTSESCEVLMQGIIELPQRLGHLQEGGVDSEQAVLALVNKAAALLNLDPLLSGDTLTEDVSEGALARFERIDGAAKIRRIRGAYQNVLLAILKGEEEERSIDTLCKVAIGLERICAGAPAEAQWQAFGVFVQSLRGVDRPLPAEVVKMLRRIDAEIRRFARDGAEAFLAPVHKSLIQQLLQAAELRSAADENTEKIRARADFDPTIDEVALSGRQALASAADALREELTDVKDRLDLFVRAESGRPAELEGLVLPLRKLASSCAVLGFESSRGILLGQADVLAEMAHQDSADSQVLISVAASLVQVEDNLAGMGHHSSPSELERFQGDAAKQVLVESRAGLEAIKQAIVDFVSSDFDAVHLEDTPAQIVSVCGALNVAGLTRPISALTDCRAFIEQELVLCASDSARVDWERLDRFADCVSGIDYYLERVGEDAGTAADDVIDVVERSIRSLGFDGAGSHLGVPEPLRLPVAEEPLEELLDQPLDQAEDALAVESENTEIAEGAEFDGELDGETQELDQKFSVDAAELEPVETVAPSELHSMVEMDDLELDPESIPSIVDLEPDMVPPPMAEPSDVQAETEEGLDAILDLDSATFDDLASEDEFAEEISEEVVEVVEQAAESNLDDAADAVATPVTSVDEPPQASFDEGQQVLESLHDFEAEAAIAEEVLTEPEPIAGALPELEAAPIEVPFEELADVQDEALAEIQFEDHEEEEAVQPYEPEPFLEAAPEEESLFDLGALDIHVEAEPEEPSDVSEFDLTGSAFDGLDAEVAETAPAIDPDILEVFVEEVGEVVETIDQSLQVWQASLVTAEDHDARTEVRRAFHTLKGSGRMVGADRLGEMAWAVENMLNRVLDGTVEANAEILDLVSTARRYVPDLLDAFQTGQSVLVEEIDQLIEDADLLASGGSLAAVDLEEEDAREAIETSEEVTIFIEEAQQLLDVLQSRIGARRVQLDDDVMMALHTLVGSASLVGQSQIEQLSNTLYDTARAFQAEAIRGPNVEVEIARLFLDAHEYMAQTVAGIAEQVEAEPVAELIERCEELLASADDTPAEEMLVGLAQLDVIINAASRFDDCSEGADSQRFVEEFHGAMQAIVGATFRPQVTDLAKSLSAAMQSQSGHEPLSEGVCAVLKQGCERLLHTVDAIAADRSLPRVDDVVTALGDLANGVTPVVAEPTEPFPGPQATVGPASLSPVPVPRAVAQQSAEQVVETIDPELADVFFEEAEELMEAMEVTLNEWSDERENRLHLENLLRVLHTLKGSARLAGLVKTGDEAHQFESFLIEAQNDEIPVDDALFERSEVHYELLVALLADTQAKIGEEAPQPASAATVTPVPEKAQISKPKPLVTHEPKPAQEMVRVGSALLESLVNLAGENSILRARVEQGMSDFSQALDEMEMTIERTREQLRRLEMETEAQVVYRNEQVDARYASFDPLEMDRYSQLQQLSRALSESASDMLDLKDTLLFKARESETLLLQQARINTELQEGLMRTRMVPFSRLLPRLRRIVRQIASELGKEVEFHAYNAEGELDRNLLERMIPPLEHMLRNAVDHGVESSDVRRSFGKAAIGRVDLRLSREGGDIVIEIADDGAGIDVEAVRVKAAEKGLSHPTAELSDEEAMEFVLAPGFSTAKSVTQISGRGVGLDVVNSEVKQLGGSVSISSTPGKGTRFVVRVPFTVSVNRALMVNIGDDLYAIPLNTIEGIVLLDPDHIEQLYNANDSTFDYAGVAYRVRYLGHYIGRPYTSAQGSGSVPVVLVRSGDQAIAVHVDGVQGSREIVVKSLGPQFAGVGGISGATILGDGSVVVILDLLALIRAYGREGFVAAKRSLELARANPCVMVVDDSVTVRKVTARLLERQGMDVIVAKDGVEAVALLQERRPDIMLLDIEMPRMDGFEVARQVRHDDRLTGLPIIMISSRTGSKHTEHAKELGVDRFLGKPFQENELLSAIDELVT